MFDSYSVIDMFGPIYGENWHAPDLHDGLTYRWSHPNPASTLIVPTLGASQVRLRLILAYPPDTRQLDELEFAVDGEPAALRWSMRGPFVNLWTDVAFERVVGSVKVRIAVPACPPLPGDPRLLGLAVNRVEVFALDEEAVGLENQRLQEQLREARLELKTARQLPVPVGGPFPVDEPRPAHLLPAFRKKFARVFRLGGDEGAGSRNAGLRDTRR